LLKGNGIATAIFFTEYCYWYCDIFINIANKPAKMWTKTEFH